ncbi:MAG: glycoside hydrolase family 5 protein [Prevotella sp.]|nr:glycoside hydrolase family 5 protein [Prevotella sp.]
MKRLGLLFFLCLLMQKVTVSAWVGMPMPKLHIEGRNLVDENGNKVLLHGFGQTYSPWFNEQGKYWTNYNVSGCLYYNKRMIAGLLTKGWKVNWIRMHMDPYWSNTPGVSVTGENDISAFSMERFKTYFESVFLRMAAYAEGKGLYVVMRPPGVCPQTIARGDAYQKYLIQVWTHVAKRMVELGNTTYMFELANEPINVEGGVTAFFQDIVDSIRATGCKNILWVPGTGYQSDYRAYAANPIKGENIGYAVHAYPGWYGSDAEVESAEDTGDVAGGGYKGFLNGWTERVGCVADFAPILVTEMDWAPKKYGCSWGKSTTGTRGGSGFGANFKYMCDLTGNVSWMLFTGPELLAQYDDSAEDGETFLTSPDACARPIYRWYNDYAAEWPASATEASKRIASLEVDCESSLTALSGGILTVPVDVIYEDGHRSCVTHTAQYSFSNPDVVSFNKGVISVKQDGNTDVTITVSDDFGTTKQSTIALNATSFPLTNADFNPCIWENGTFDEQTGTLVTGQYGFGGWQYGSGLDISKWKYIIIELYETQSAGASFRLFDEKSYWTSPAMVDIGTVKRKVITLSTLKKNGTTTALNLKNIYIAGFWSTGGKPIRIKSVFLSNVATATGIEDDIQVLHTEEQPQPVYNLQGQRVSSMRKGGTYIIGGKKVVR